MNATQTAILKAITDIKCHDVANIVNEISKSETTVRKNLKELEAAGLVRRDGKSWYVVIEPTVESNDEYTQLMNDTEAEDAAAAIEAAEDGTEIEIIDTITDDGTEPEAIEAAAIEAETPAETTDQPAAVEPAAKDADTADATPDTRKYKRHATPTTRTVRTNQITGARLQVLRNGEAAEDGTSYTVSSKWMTVCLTHGMIGEFNKVLDAHFASSYPSFCPTCKSKMTDDQIGRRRAVKVQP